jgi:hypothetical protein
MDYILNRSQINYILSNNSLLREQQEEIKNVDDGIINENYNTSNISQSFIRDQLKAIYNPKGMWKKAPNPNNDCETNFGVVGGKFPHTENDTWSILNRFDTNKKVLKKIEEFHKDSNSIDPSSDISLLEWIKKNREDLFGENGFYTEELVNIARSTYEKGSKSETYAENILKNIFPNTKIKRYCAGHKHDTKQGIDLTVEHSTKVFNVQVKPFISVNSYFEPDGDTFFEVKSYFFNNNKYSQKHVEVFMFVNTENNQYILFKNTRNKIGNMGRDVTRFYDPYLATNMTFEHKQKRQMEKFKDIDKIFGLDSNLEKNLEFRIKTLQKLLNDLRSGKK